jgi:hypothetical protein
MTPHHPPHSHLHIAIKEEAPVFALQHSQGAPSIVAETSYQQTAVAVFKRPSFTI